MYSALNFAHLVHYVRAWLGEVKTLLKNLDEENIDLLEGLLIRYRLYRNLEEQLRGELNFA